MYEDDTGLIYMRARYYCPALRRFVNADKLHGDISNALTLNRYSFCNGDPANGVDPLGLAWDNARGGSNTASSIKKPLDWSRATLEEMNRDIWEYIKEESKVGDGEYALIDNYRNQIDGIFHEQWFYCKNRNHDLGMEFELALSKAGWHGDNWEFAPLNFGSASAELYADVTDYKNFNVGAGVSASAWEIENSTVIGDYKVTISFGFGAGRGFSLNMKDGELIEGTIAPSRSPISISWKRVE